MPSHNSVWVDHSKSILDPSKIARVYQHIAAARFMPLTPISKCAIISPLDILPWHEVPSIVGLRNEDVVACFVFKSHCAIGGGFRSI